MLTKLALPCLRGAGLLRPSLGPARASCNCVLDVPTAALIDLLDVPTTALVAAADQTVSLDALGSDIFIFLAASVLVVPLSRVLNVTPVLGFLALGCGIGPYGLGLFGNSEADLQLGARATLRYATPLAACPPPRSTHRPHHRPCSSVQARYATPLAACRRGGISSRRHAPR